MEALTEKIEKFLALDYGWGGRNAFVKNHGIDLENGMYTVEEFIEITKDSYGGEIIRNIQERLKNNGRI